MPVRAGIAIRRPGLHVPMGRAGADHCRKLRQYADFALLRQRKRRHVTICVPPHRRSGDCQAPNIPRQRPRERAFAPRRAPLTHITEQHVTETAVMPSELGRLPDLCGYFKTPQLAGWLKVTFGNRSGARRPLD